MSRNIRSALLCAALLAAAPLLPAPAAAISISFDCISNNSATDCGIAESQLTASIDPAGPGIARLVLTNDGPEDAVYARIFVDGTVLSGVDDIVNGAGVSFAEASPAGTLPAGNTVGFDEDLEIAADNPRPQNGIGPGETLTIDFAIAAGSDIFDVIAALTDGSLRFGIHVQSFESGGSEAIVNVPVPEPHSIALLGLGLAGLVRIGRRRA